MAAETESIPMGQAKNRQLVAKTIRLPVRLAGLNADAVLDAISIVPSVGIEVVGRATVHPIAGAKVTAY